MINGSCKGCSNLGHAVADVSQIHKGFVHETLKAEKKEEKKIGVAFLRNNMSMSITIYYYVNVSN